MFSWFKSKKRPPKVNTRHLSNDNPRELTSNLENNLLMIKEIIGHSFDVVIRPFKIGHIERKAAVIYVDGLVDMTTLQEQIIKPLMQDHTSIAQFPRISDQIKNMIIDTALSVGKIKEVHNLNDCVLEVLSTTGGESRSIDEPVSEAVVRGPRDGFVETLSKNIVLIRRRIRDPNFTMVSYKVGRRSQTDLIVLYIKGLTNPELVDEVKSRIEQIDIDDVLESGYIEQLIEDNYLSPFPQIQNTERPDRVVGALMAGRVALLVDGTPFALIVPVTFSMLMVSQEDYYERWLPGSLIRLLRYSSAFIALFLPSIYIALISYNHGLIPTKLVISIAAGREGVPFPSIIEALGMEVTLEILREAGLRLPKPIGQAVGIVGGLVIGQAAVQAGIVSPVMVIVVALTAIASFAFPQYGAGIAIRMLRFVSMMFAALFGVYGIILFFILTTVHVVKLTSFGVPYSAPFAPYQPKDWKDTLVRLPLRFMKDRPKITKPQDQRRQK